MNTEVASEHKFRQRQLQKQQASSLDSDERRAFVLGVLAVIAAFISLHLIYLITFQREFLLEESARISLRVEQEKPIRGMILDREGEQLAVSTVMSWLVIDPKNFLYKMRLSFEKLTKECAKDHGKNPQCSFINEESLQPELRFDKFCVETLEPLAEFLERDVGELYDNLLKVSDMQYLYLMEREPPQSVQQALSLKIPSVYEETRYHRYYPSAEVLGQITGHTSLDGRGISGIEQVFDKELTGEQGETPYYRSIGGKVIDYAGEKTDAVKGKNIQLSINKRIQYVMFDALRQAQTQFEPTSLSAIMMDVHSGEILGAISIPAGNPNNEVEWKSDSMNSKMLMEIFEPGSTIKPIVMAAALENHAVTPQSVFNTNGIYKINGNSVRDTSNHHTMNAIEVIAKSSNIGMSMIVENLPRDKYYQFMRNMGFGQKTNIKFAGEAAGILHSAQQMSDFEYATNSFGYNISVSGLQLVRAFAAIANDGILPQPTLLKIDEIPPGKRVMSSQTARDVFAMLVAAVDKEGTGKRANTANYSVAGKTGTVHLIIDGRYSKNNYNSLFAGIAPANDPKIALIVVVNDPQKGKYYGGTVAAPIFSQIVSHSLKILGVLPDKIDKVDEINLIFNQNSSSKK